MLFHPYEGSHSQLADIVNASIRKEKGKKGPNLPMKILLGSSQPASLSNLRVSGSRCPNYFSIGFLAEFPEHVKIHL